MCTRIETQRQGMAGQSTGGLTFHPSTSDRTNQLSIRVTVKEKRVTEKERGVGYTKEWTNNSISSVCPVPADQVTRQLCMRVAQRFRGGGNSGRAQCDGGTSMENCEHKRGI